MNIILSKEQINKIESDIELIIVKELKNLSKEEQKILKKISFDLNSFDTYFDVNTNKFYVSCQKLKKEDLKLCFSSAIRNIKKLNIKSVKLDLIQNDKELNINEIVEGLVLGSYEFTKYKSEKKKLRKILITISTLNSKNDAKVLEKALANALAITSSVNMVRSIINTPPEDYFPATMANDAKNIASENNLQCIIHGEDYLIENGMNAMLNVGRASRHESKLIHLTYKPNAENESKGKIVLVGKGLTYDSGGLSLKFEFKKWCWNGIYEVW